jgi:hypothetical protein
MDELTNYATEQRMTDTYVVTQLSRGERSGRRLRRWLSFARAFFSSRELVVLRIACPVVFGGLMFDIAFAKTTTPAPFKVTLEQPTLRSNVVTVSGHARPRVDLVIWDSKESTGQKQPGRPIWRSRQIIDRVRTDAHGRFTAEGILEDGRHLIWAASPNCTEADCFAMAKSPVFVEGAFPPPGPFRPTRNLSISLRYQELRAILAVTLPRTNGDALSLLRDDRGLPTFVKQYFPLAIHGPSNGAAKRDRVRTLDTLFTNALPQINVNEESVTVRADSRYQRPGIGILPTGDGMLWIEPIQWPAKPLWGRDTLRVDVADYAAADPAPLPVQVIGQSFTWERPYDPDGSRVGIALRAAPTSSMDALKHFLQSSPYQFARHDVARFLAFTHGFYYALPMFAYLVLTRGRGRLYKAARVFIIVAVASDVFLACRDSQADINVTLKQMLSAHRLSATEGFITELLAPLTMAFALCAIAGAVAAASTVLRDPARTIINEAARAVVGASLLFGTLVIAQYITAIAPVPHLTAAPMILALVAIGALWAASFFAIAPPGRARVVFIASAVFFVLLFSLPTTIARYGPWQAGGADVTAFASPTGLLPLATEYFRTILILCPALFGVMLICSVRRGLAWLGLSPQQLGHILLSCYVVDISGVIVIVPIGFLIAWPTYKLIIRTTLLPERIRSRRASVVAEALCSADSTEIAGQIATLRSKFVEGSLSRSDFESARSRGLDELAKSWNADTANVLGLTLESDPWKAGLSTLPIALGFSISHVILFLALGIGLLSGLHPAFYTLLVIAVLLSQALSFLIGGFAFGACYDYLRGRSGTQKAFVVVAWAVLCSAPSWFLRVDSTFTVVALAVEVAIFYTALGISIDLRIVRAAMGPRFRLTDLARLSGVSAVSWTGGIVTASIAVGINAVVSGSFQQGMTQFVEALVKSASRS